MPLRKSRPIIPQETLDKMRELEESDAAAAHRLPSLSDLIEQIKLRQREKRDRESKLQLANEQAEERARKRRSERESRSRTESE